LGCQQVKDRQKGPKAKEVGDGGKRVLVGGGPQAKDFFAVGGTTEANCGAGLSRTTRQVERKNLEGPKAVLEACVGKETLSGVLPEVGGRRPRLKAKVPWPMVPYNK